jgi:hypothetical protein
MGFKLGAFFGGVAKGATDLIEEKEKENTLQIKESVKNMYHNYAEYRKETEKKKTEIRDVVGSLRSFKFADGPLDEKELIALASDLPTAKAIAEELRKNPDKFDGLSKSFIKGSDRIKEGQTFSDYVDQYGKTAKMSAEQLAAAVGTRDEGFLNKMVYGENVNKIKAAAAKYGVTAEELYSSGAGRDSKSLPSLLEVDYSKLQKTPEFKDLKDKAMVVMYRAKQEGTDAEILAASKNMGAIKGTELMAELKEKPKESQQDIEIDYGKRILAATDPKQKAKLTSELRTQQDLWANPSLKKLTDGEKITTGNKLVAYKGIINSTVSNYLPPGTFKTNPITGDLEVTELVKSGDFAKGKKAGMEAAIAFGTDQNGRPKSNEDRLALASVGVQFDQDNKAFAPKVEFAVEAAPAPVAPLKRDGRGGGPMAPKPKPAAAAPAAPAASAPIDKATARAQATAAIAGGAKAGDVAKRFKETYGEDL